MSNAKQIIDKIEELKISDSIASYPHIKNILANQRFPLAMFEYQPYKIIRYRRHYHSDPFYFQKSSDLSYRTDLLNINNFGRCNEPGQGLFYCNDNDNENTGLTEAISIFRGNENSLEESFTVGAWNVNSPLKLVVILPSNDILGKNKEFDELKNSYNTIDTSDDFEDLKILNEYLSKEFILDTLKNKSNYKVTCAFANYIKQIVPDIDGIIYGSVKYEHRGQNIVLWPEVADSKLEFFAARKLTLTKISEKTFQESFSAESKGYDLVNDIIKW